MSEKEATIDRVGEILDKWIDSVSGSFQVSDIMRMHSLYSPSERAFLKHHLDLAILYEKIEPVGTKWGTFRPLKENITEIDFLNVKDTEGVEIWLPLRLYEYVKIYPGNIIIFYGSPNAGKSAFIYNTIIQNCKSWDVHLFNSESGAVETHERLSKFQRMGFSVEDFWMKCYECASDFHRVVKPGEGKLNCIDFLEIHDEFYKVGAAIKQIHDVLDGAICIIGLQKNPGAEVGLGGFRSLEVARLAIAIDSCVPNVCTVIKAKNVKKDYKIDGIKRNFRLVDGCEIIPEGDWRRPTQKK